MSKKYADDDVTRSPYQRKSVWSLRKKQALIDSLFRRCCADDHRNQRSWHFARILLLHGAQQASNSLFSIRMRIMRIFLSTIYQLAADQGNKPCQHARNLPQESKARCLSSPTRRRCQSDAFERISISGPNNAGLETSPFTPDASNYCCVLPLGWFYSLRGFLKITA
ncbi:hypothetical protein HG15A2_21940 [Adhaeretor mobilis]|uniref:Uncharacterized protein n=1 Tax=Adhaeretor mobilis TaxID=1930276 RepID=A0A517MVK0_9BACT|nr:hypothetical protein HG15A2_21940 [Adhaeretor mobilis]